jgi:hypothetical protein
MESAAAPEPPPGVRLLKYLEALQAVVPVPRPSGAKIAHCLGLTSGWSGSALLRRCAALGWVRLEGVPGSQTVQLLVTSRSVLPRLEPPRPKAATTAKVLSSQDAQHLRKLMAWLEKANGRREAVCPSNATIATRLGLLRASSATRIISAAAAEGYLEVTGRTGGQDIRRVRVLRDPPPLPGRVPLLAQQPAGDFTRWLGHAAAGETFTYFIGHLAEARAHAQEAKATDALRQAVAQAAVAQEAHKAGLVLLTLRRRSDGQGCDYIAVCRRQAAA